MKVKALLAIAAALALSACVVADDPYYDDYSRENSVRDYDHYDHGPRYRDRDDRDYRNDRDYRDDRRSRRNSRIDSKFNCENGLSVQVRSLSPDRIELRLDDKRAVLSSDVSGSGERYTAGRGLFGKGAEWHQKGDEAFFSFIDPYGNKVDTSCRAR